MELYLLNYADDRFGHKGGQFLRNQAKLNESAKQQGIQKIVSWQFADLAATTFYADHKEYLDQNRFVNGAVWKPYIVQHLLKQIQDGDIIFYYDCGPYEIQRPVDILVKLCRQNQGTLFHEWGEKNSKYTKRDAFVYMGCDSPRYHQAPALQNTWFLLQKNAFTEKFIDEWLTYNLDERIASYIKPNTCGLPDLLGFVENRGDQSIFSNLAIKYSIRTFRGAGGIKNRQVNNFIDSLAWKNRLQQFKENSKKQVKTWLKDRTYQMRMSGKPLKFTIASECFYLHASGGAVRQLWSGDQLKIRTLESILTLVTETSTIVEIGANVGVMTVPFAKKISHGKLCAIEADPHLCQSLEQNLTLNSCSDRVTIVPIAASHDVGHAKLQVNSQWRDPFNTIGRPIDENCQIVAVQDIPTATLTEILQTKQFPNPDLLVIDASGAELPILKGAIALLASETGPIVVYNCQHQACLGFGYQPVETQALLRHHKYQLFWLNSHQKFVKLPEDSKHQGFIFGFKEDPDPGTDLLIEDEFPQP